MNFHKNISNHFSVLICVAALTFTFSVQANAQSSSKQGRLVSKSASKSEGEAVVLNFQNTDIHALINLVSDVTGKNFIVDPRVKAKVTIYSGSELDADQLYEVFLSVLDVHSMAAVRSGGLTKIVPVNNVKQLSLPTSYDKKSPTNVADDVVTQVYKLEHASAADVLPIIRPLIPSESHVAVHPGSGTLIFTGTGSNVKRVIGILNHLDVDSNDFNIRIIQLKHAQASSLKEALTSLISSVVSDGGVKGAKAKASVYAEDSSNSLIINGSDEAFSTISSVVKKLDVKRPKRRDVHVVQLKFAKAADMVSILTEVGQKISPSSKDAAGNISVQTHESSNALILYANDVDFLALKSVIDQLDIRPKQVFIEAIIAEVSFNKTVDLGIELNGNVASGGGGSSNTNFRDVTGGLSFDIINELVLNSAGAAVPDLGVVLNALESDSSTNILSTPNLLTVDNEKAEIIVGQQVPFVTGRYTSTTSTAGGGNNSTPAPFQTIERRDVGLKLTVTPRVNTAGLVTLEVEQEISNVSPRLIQGASDLVTDERRISATVQAESGKIVVIGGLIRDDILNTDEQVPLLGRIPIIGNLFKRRNDQVLKTNLMVFLRPRVIDSTKEANSYTQEKYDHMRGLSASQRAKGGGLLSYKGVETLPAFHESNNIKKFSDDSVSPELLEMAWRYALPEQNQTSF